MTWPEYSVWTQVAWWGLVALTLFSLGRTWLRIRTSAPGMRFPTGHRVDGVRRGLRARLVHTPLVLRTLALPLLVMALSRPQLTEEETADVEGIDIVVAFDMSGSMASVDISDEDLVRLQNENKEPKDRFTIATEVVRDFIQTRKYDRVSLVVFGLFGPVAWGAVAVAAPATLVGGYLGARVARRVPDAVLRPAVIAFAVLVALALAVR